VLLAGDTSILPRILTRFLQDRYHNAVVVVGAAGGGEETLAQAQERNGPIVSIGLAMPGLGGVEPIGCLRRLLPKGASSR
jgi:DNA-binding NarL/FixJ family response regulator